MKAINLQVNKRYIRQDFKKIILIDVKEINKGLIANTIYYKELSNDGKNEINSFITHTDGPGDLPDYTLVPSNATKLEALKIAIS